MKEKILEGVQKYKNHTKIKILFPLILSAGCPKTIFFFGHTKLDGI